MKFVLFIFSACLSLLVVVVASPHNFHVARRHAIAARAAVAISDDVPLKRRQSNRRCKNRSSSAASSSTSSTPTVKPSPERLNPSPSTSTTHNNYPAPTTTTTTPAPETTPTPTTTAQNSNLPSFMYGVQTGQATYFDVGLGACGWTSQGTEYVVAVSHTVYDNYPGYTGANSNNNPICGKKIKATYQGKSVTVTVVDRCADVTCLPGNLDFSRTAFAQMSSLDAGRLFGMQWEWVS